MIYLVAYLLTAVLFIAAGITRREQGRWLLFIAALAVIVLNAFSIAIGDRFDSRFAQWPARPIAYVSIGEILTRSLRPFVSSHSWRGVINQDRPPA